MSLVRRVACAPTLYRPALPCTVTALSQLDFPSCPAYFLYDPAQAMRAERPSPGLPRVHQPRGPGGVGQGPGRGGGGRHL
jgi:hypothetical protein